MSKGEGRESQYSSNDYGKACVHCGLVGHTLSFHADFWHRALKPFLPFCPTYFSNDL